MTGPNPVPRGGLVLGHRGASAHFPENTLASLLGALQGTPAAQGVECDVRVTRDGVPVLFHDDDLARLTGQAGAIEDCDWSQLAGLRVGGEPIPTLEDAIAALGTAGRPGGPWTLNIELKTTPRFRRLVDICRPILDPLTSRADLSLVVSSFDPRILDAARSSATGWRLAILYDSLDALGALPLLDVDGPVDLHPAHGLVDADFRTRHVSREGVAHPRTFRVWTVDDARRAETLFGWGIDGVISNDPNGLVQALTGSGS